MKLLCIKSKAAHWGSILTKGKEYEVIKEKHKSIEIITDYDNYWKYASLIAGSRDWIRKGYTKSNLHEVIPDYITSEEIHERYTKRLSLLHFDFNGDDESIVTMCVATNAELFEMGADVSKSSNKLGKPAFGYTVYQLDDYFDYNSIRRDNKLNQIL